LTANEIAAEPWLHGALEHRKLLAPKKRGPKKSKDKKAKKAPRRSNRCDTPDILPLPESPEVLPTAPADLPMLAPLQPRPLMRASPVFIHSPSSEQSDTSSDSSSRPSSVTLVSQGVDVMHRNASPPTIPSDALMESDSSDEELLNFCISDYNRESRRRRAAGLPSPRTRPYVDIPTLFLLVSRY
jgi:hypothetical protein